MMTAMKSEVMYLRGANVIVETDCLPLLGIYRTCDHADVHMQRWVCFIRSFAPVLRHIKGKDNVIADMLSRSRYATSPEPTTETATFWVRAAAIEPALAYTHGVKEFCETDYEDDLKRIGEYLSREGIMTGEEVCEEFSPALRRTAENFLLKDGHLFRKGTPPRRVLGRPEDRRNALLDAHDEHWGGHRGQQSTYAKLKDRFWWPKMSVDVRRYVESCETCQKFSKMKNRDALLATTPKGLNHSWVFDLVKMPKSAEGYNYAAVAREETSNWAEACALRNKTTQMCCRFIFTDIVARFGVFGRMRADNGELNSEEARAFFKELGISLNLTTTYNPEANGKSERGHQPLIASLAKACAKDPRAWARKLPFALWADRTTICRTTGYAPAELMLGAIPPSPFDGTLATWFIPEWRDHARREDLIHWRIQQYERREEHLAVAVERLTAARERSVADANATRTVRPVKIQPGDWVLVWRSELDNQHAATRKFTPKWTGPYVVVDIDEFNSYRLRTLDDITLTKRVAGKRIKLFVRRN
jgi:hypothetical protein